MENNAQSPIVVFEEVGVLRRLTGAIMAAIVFLVIFFGVIFTVPEPEPSSFLPTLILLIGGSWVIALIVGFIILFTGRKRAQVKPILAISENSTYWDTPEGGIMLFWFFGLVFGSIIKSFARKSKFLISEQGVVFYRMTGPTVVRWKNIKSYKIDRSNNIFSLNRGKGIWLTLVCTQNFDEANKILSNYIKIVET
jgi:ABC-type multidrug transport system fused ATPase/permease subunit